MSSGQWNEKAQSRLAHDASANLLKVWQMVKNGKEPEDQSDRYLAKAIRMHPEYQKELDALQEIGAEIEWAYPKGETSPATHLTCSAVAESLIQNNKSAGVFSRRMKDKGLSDHQIQHMVGMIFLGEYRLACLLGVRGEVLNPRRIDTLFRKYSRVPPEEFSRKLEQEYRSWED